MTQQELLRQFQRQLRDRQKFLVDPIVADRRAVERKLWPAKPPDEPRFVISDPHPENRDTEDSLQRLILDDKIEGPEYEARIMVLLEKFPERMLSAQTVSKRPKGTQPQSATQLPAAVVTRLLRLCCFICGLCIIAFELIQKEIHPALLVAGAALTGLPTYLRGTSPQDRGVLRIKQASDRLGYNEPGFSSHYRGPTNSHTIGFGAIPGSPGGNPPPFAGCADRPAPDRLGKARS